jgi:hypothetical protein
MADHVPALVLVDTPPPRTQTLATDRAVRHGTTQRPLISTQLASQIRKLHDQQYRARMTVTERVDESAAATLSASFLGAPQVGAPRPIAGSRSSHWGRRPYFGC